MNSKRCNVIAEELEGRSVTGRISTTAVDRDGDVLLPSGIDARDFKQNPVVLFGHDAGRLPIGRAVNLMTTPNEVLASVEFAARPAEHPDAAEWVPDTIHSLFKQGVLNAFSVGFTVPKNGVRESTKEDRNRFGKSCERVVTRWKLLEFSVVPIPANQTALATAVSKGLHLDGWTRSQLESASELPMPGKQVRMEVRPLEIRVPLDLG